LRTITVRDDTRNCLVVKSYHYLSSGALKNIEIVIEMRDDVYCCDCHLNELKCCSEGAAERPIARMLDTVFTCVVITSCNSSVGRA
jgi:hypothetical protein